MAGDVEPAPAPAPAPGTLVPHRHLGGWTVVTSIALGIVALQLTEVTEWAARDAGTEALVRDRFFVEQGDLAYNHERFVFLTKGTVLLVAVAAVLWLVWQYQAHANLRALSPARMRAGIAVVAWLVPVLNLAVALIAMRDLWLGSDQEEREPDSPGPGITPVLWLWWGCLVVAVALTLFGVVLTAGSLAPAGRLVERDHLLVVACLLGITAAVLGIVLLVKIESRLRLREHAILHPGWQGWSRVTSNRRPSS